MPTIVADPDLPTAAPADPDAAYGTNVSSPAVPPRSGGVTAAINAFGARIAVQLQRLADKDSTSGLRMSQPVDANGFRITNVADSHQLKSLVTRTQAQALLDE
jgi:hypothetical protein